MGPLSSASVCEEWSRLISPSIVLVIVHSEYSVHMDYSNNLEADHGANISRSSLRNWILVICSCATSQCNASASCVQRLPLSRSRLEVYSIQVLSFENRNPSQTAEASSEIHLKIWECQ